MSNNILSDLFDASTGAVLDSVILSSAKAAASSDTINNPGTYVLSSIATANGYPIDFTGKCLLVVSGTTQPLVTTQVLFADGKLYAKASNADAWELADGSYTDEEVDQMAKLTALVNSVIDASGKLKQSAMPDVLQHNKGIFAAASEMPTTDVQAGDYCVNTTTDTVWIYDADTSAWVDSDRKGQVTSVNGQTGEVVLDINSFVTDWGTME